MLLLTPNKGETVSLDIDKIGEVNKLIHEPSRLKIMAILDVLKETDFTYLKRETEFSWGRLSSHLEKLEKAKYIEMRKELVLSDKRKVTGKKVAKTFVSMTKLGKNQFDNYKNTMRDLFK